jgi:CubicO group peptidase (beta-lactamase class C family)
MNVPFWWRCCRARAMAPCAWQLLALVLAGLGASSLPAAGQEVWPGTGWTSAAPAAVGMNATRTADAVAYARSRGGSGILIRHGTRVATWGDQQQKYGLLSATKSIGSILLGVAIKEGRVSLAGTAQPALPELGLPPDSNQATGWLPLITVHQLATHTAGFEKDGGFGVLLAQPGTAWSYSDGGTNWLADLLTVRFQQDLQAVLRSRVLTPMGIANASVAWRANRYRPQQLRGIARREFGSGISTNVDVLARIGLMLLRDGRWKDRRILPVGYAAEAASPQPALAFLPVLGESQFQKAPQHYGLLFWNNADGAMPGVPRDAYWAWGKGEEILLVIPSQGIVVARLGPAWSGTFGKYSILEPFFTRVAAAVN